MKKKAELLFNQEFNFITGSTFVLDGGQTRKF